MLKDKNRSMFADKIADAYGLRRVPGQFGVEIEVGGVRLPAHVPGWGVHREGSLRDGGVEYVTQGGVDRETLSILIDHLRYHILNQGSRVHNTYQAGIHIHYNCQKYSFDETLRAIIGWIICEPIFLKLCGPERDGNLFCLSSYDTGDFYQFFGRLFKAVERGEHPAIYFKRGKYSSLNIDPIQRFGTLECRTFPSTLAKDEILRYVDLVDSILKRKDIHPEKMRELATNSPDKFCEIFFGKIEMPRNYISLLDFGLEFAFPIIELYTEYMGEE